MNIQVIGSTAFWGAVSIIDILRIRLRTSLSIICAENL